MSEGIIVALINKGSELLIKLCSLFRPSKNNNSFPKLVDHYIFYKLEVLLTYLKTNFQLENKAKQLAFTCLLENIIKIYKKNLYELAQKVDNNEITTCEDLLNENIKVFNATLDEYSKFYLNGYFSYSEQRVLAIVVELFNHWHGPRISYIQESMQNTCNSKFYGNSIKIKQSVIFDIYIGVFVDMINDAESALDSLNGSLRGLLFKGYRF